MAQDLVTHAVPERVIDVLELVEVDEEHGAGLVGVLMAALHALDALEDQRAVRQARQRVARGETLQCVARGA